MLETRLRTLGGTGGSSSSGTSGTVDTSGLVRTDQTTTQTIASGKLAVDGFQFNNNPPVGATSAGKLYWDVNWRTLAVNMDTASTLQIGQESVVYGYANENIANGDAVYISGSSANYPTLNLAIANNDLKARVKGIATEAIPAGSLGFVTNFGIVNDLNTNAFTAGDLVYLSASVSGGITNVQPTPPNQQIVIGRALFKNASSGSIFRSSSPNYPISADQIDLQKIVGATKHSLQDLYNTWGVGLVAGGALLSTSATTISVSSGNCIIALGTSDTDPVTFANFNALPTTVVSDQRVTWITVQYAGNSAGIVTIEGANMSDSSVPAAINYQSVFPLGYVTRYGAETYVTNNARRMQDALGGLVGRFYQTLPLARDERLGGLIIGEQATRFITLSAGKLWDRQNQFPISAMATTSGSVFSTWYRSGTGFIETENVTQWPNNQYDDGSGTLQPVASNRYANLWWYLSTESSLSMVYGRNIYNSAANAATGSVPATLPLPLSTHYKLIGRSTFQGNATAFTANDSIFTNQFNPSAATAHNNLGGLQGGNAGEYYHLTNSEYVGVGSGVFLRQDSANVSRMTFLAGTTANAPIYFTSGALLSVASAGALEFDGAKLYISF